MSQTEETVTYSLAAVLTRLEGKMDNLQKDVTDLKIGQTEIKGEIKALDERLTTEIKGLNERVKYQEFTNRGILIALVVAILGGTAKVFGWIGNP
jgi:hypothetical protein